MELRVRPLLAVLGSAALAVVLGLFIVPRLTHLAPAAPTTPVVPAAPIVAPAAGPVVTYRDASLGWDWQVACTPQFQRFLAAQLAGQPISAVDVVLVDYQLDSKLPFGTTYRGARVAGNCYNQQGRFTCQLAIVSGEPGADVDVAATLNTPYTLLDMFLARGADPNAVRRTWGLATFQPLLVPAEEANLWQSACLQLSRGQ